jgi:2-polyprenyl-3-methyl-5-hydroxy-6-metoxy-1,4-benzoquinol methylase
VVFLSPEEQESKKVDALYSKDYFTEREGYFFHDGVADGSGHESPHIEDFRLGLELIAAHARPPGKLLDVGCATGSFLSLAKGNGWECRGVEVSSFAAAQARERTGCEVFCGQFAHAPFADGMFDVVTMWDLLEHLPDPVTALRKAGTLLKANGLLLVNTPNEDSLTRMVARFLYRGTGGWLQAPVNRLYHHYHLMPLQRRDPGAAIRAGGVRPDRAEDEADPDLAGAHLPRDEGGHARAVRGRARHACRVRADHPGAEARLASRAHCRRVESCSTARIHSRSPRR